VIDFRLDTAFYFGRHESELVPHFHEMLKQGDKTFDVGGYRGWDAISFANISRAPVVVFEAGTQNCQFIAHTARASGFEIEVVQGFVSDCDADDGRLTLDTAAERFFVPDFIKMDVEGAEAAALRGAKHILIQRHPSLLIEVHGAQVEADCVRQVTEAGYTPFALDRAPGFLNRSRRGHNRWLICRGRPSDAGRSHQC
jgi:hypothetical protein